MDQKSVCWIFRLYSLYDIVLSDKEIDMIFKQLQDLSELNIRYKNTETDNRRLNSMYSVNSNYTPTKVLLEITNELYKGDTIEKQFEQYKKIID